MSKIGNINNHLDLTGLQELKAQATKDPESKEALKKAAAHFESIFIGMMLKSMRKANEGFEQDNPMNSNTTKFFRDMYDQQLSTDMAVNGSMGLADIIVKQLSNDTDNYKAASTLRNDGGMSRQAFYNDEKPQDTVIPSNSIINPIAKPTTQSNSILGDFNSVIDKSFSAIGAEKPTAADANLANSQQKLQKAVVNFDSPDEFVGSLWQFAKKAAAKIGVNPAVIIAQSALETGWGQHIIKDKDGESSFNLFNVKAHRDWDGEKAAQSTLEFEKGIAVRKTEPFRVYSNFSEAFDDFVNFLKSNSRYDEALDNTAKPEQFLQELQKAGYATDPNYADKIIGILNSSTFKDVVGKVTQSKNNMVGE
ncbi:flagellar rod assembly protein/muramidase FlgJ [Psychrosphaera saromensis]|uniref:Peptidoglycan hydrolase FlgJ n=1 Tax=Psychrosphaera saromensis TaxID=716813 RepID=A0A2S7UWB6_9GAMM|nr:flagellar assembly peptidoglycan hydrolase FlgJ [Psychrosphaera saromensis]PQJ53802.1 flagellar rod assembly protein/muramidase FlgJ [Psychrosphaera saromensis]GHB62203.1 flagellar rod assembly protein/muramidase FlgJ [Psychrosphaera saromensis]GLQ15407.1 flagellar rod assembly protein/muramidase FlgJ [Psychrosphaera saromensis]